MFGKMTCMLAAGSALLVSASASASLIAHYALDEVSGTTAADSAGSNDGTIVGAAADLTVSGILGTGFGTPGPANYVEVADNATAGLYAGNAARSISLWYSADTVLTQGRLIGSGSGAAAQFDITLETASNSNGVSIGLRYGNGNMFWSGGGIDLDDGELHHVAVTYDGTNLVADSSLRVYIDGVLQTRDGGNNNNSGQALVTGDGFWIASETTHIRGFNGVIDEVRVYDHALSQSEVTDLASVPEPGSFALLGLGGLLIVRRRRG